MSTSLIASVACLAALFVIASAQTVSLQPFSSTTCTAASAGSVYTGTNGQCFNVGTNSVIVTCSSASSSASWEAAEFSGTGCAGSPIGTAAGTGTGCTIPQGSTTSGIEVNCAASSGGSGTATNIYILGYNGGSCSGGAQLSAMEQNGQCFADGNGAYSTVNCASNSASSSWVATFYTDSLCSTTPLGAITSSGSSCGSGSADGQTISARVGCNGVQPSAAAALSSPTMLIAALVAAIVALVRAM